MRVYELYIELDDYVGVTGGTGLLGKAFCHELLENGARVSYNMG